MLEDDFPDIIKKARNGLGLKVEEVAPQAGVEASALRALEEGRRSPDREEVLAIAAVLGMDGSKLASISCDSWLPVSPEENTAVSVINGDIGGYAVKGYILRDAKSGETAIIDTGYNAEAILTTLEREGGRLKAICLTHGHVDHAGGLDRILSRFPAPVYLGEEDWSLLNWKPPVSLRRFVEDGDGLDLGSVQLRFLKTPGHTPGGVCYLAPWCAFVGDTLFAGSIGRANPPSLYPIHLRSVRERLLTLPGDLALFPGHGPATTVAQEKAHNPFG
ncbi:MAG TPA: MBL fold metallo-hydrolase [Nitrospirales bacterium]|jgi:glyoxylase-like metal-dependent hydrolase (beta-lactamase superfamily II)